ncbi:MAG TPA: GNAT family protein [Sedimentisphaerales bacterium]|nr:GNAT family protein [Sedimentisphaerales bacterium]HRV47700.1 GNAT family protein [Sedimentisphaerales bacterium]
MAAGIGFSIMPARRGQGYATEIVGMLLTWAFEGPCVRRILAHTTAQNVASCRVLERCAFRPSGHIEESQTIRFECLRPSQCA